MPPPALVLRRERPRTLKTVVERRTVSQTVVHNHITQVLCQKVHPRRDTVYRLLPPARTETAGEERSRPTLWARRLVRLFSIESARQELRPFFHTVVQNVLDGERERVKSRPEQAVSLVFRMLGETYFLQTLDRLRREGWERSAAEAAAPPSDPPEREACAPRLSGAEYQALVRGVERALERRSHLETLRRGRA